jgi:hypothetical protein
MTGPLAYGLQSARVLGQLQYSRRAEVVADEEGLNMLQAARIDPAGMIRILRYAREGGPNSPAKLLQVPLDPSQPDRPDRGPEDAGDRGATPPVPLLPDADWDDVKKICAGPAFRSVP